jgi:hypothetical protein
MQTLSACCADFGGVEVAKESQGAMAERIAPLIQARQAAHPLRYSVLLLCQFG